MHPYLPFVEPDQRIFKSQSTVPHRSPSTVPVQPHPTVSFQSQPFVSLQSQPIAPPKPTLSVASASNTIVTSSVSSPSDAHSDCSSDLGDFLGDVTNAHIDHALERLQPPLYADPQSNQSSQNGVHLTRDYASLFSPPPSRTPLARLPLAPKSLADDLSTLHLSDTCAKTDAVDLTHPLDAIHSSMQTIDLRNIPSNNIDFTRDFPRLFKVMPCISPVACKTSGNTAECFFYHTPTVDRRRPNVALYKPHMCRFIDETGGCRKGDNCPFSHNEFERRYHPDRFGKETCRDFLRGVCPRRYCTFRHHVSKKVEVALKEMESMEDKEMLQFVLKLSEEHGRLLCDKLLRRFGQGKKHSGWKLEGFHPHGRDDQKIKYVSARVEAIKKQLKASGEKKWASSLKTSSLRDMMSGVRKVAEEMRERCRADESYAENGSEIHRLIRSVFSNTNWSCHSQEGDNPFLVTPENQNDAVSSLEYLVGTLVVTRNGQGSSTTAGPYPSRVPTVNGNNGKKESGCASSRSANVGSWQSRQDVGHTQMGKA